MPNYMKMDVEELEQRAQKLDKDIADANRAMDQARDKARQKVLKLHGEFDEVMAALMVKQKLGNMNDAEKAALAQMVHAEGIESAESVNGG